MIELNSFIKFNFLPTFSAVFKNYLPLTIHDYIENAAKTEIIWHIDNSHPKGDYCTQFSFFIGSQKSLKFLRATLIEMIWSMQVQLATWD